MLHRDLPWCVTPGKLLSLSGTLSLVKIGVDRCLRAIPSKGRAKGQVIDGPVDFICYSDCTAAVSSLGLGCCYSVGPGGADGKAGTCFVCPGLESPHFTDAKIVLQIWKDPAAGWSFPRLESACLMAQPYSPVLREGRQVFLFCVFLFLRQE